MEILDFIDNTIGPLAPILYLALFMGSSFLMIWRLSILEDRGFQGTFLGTLVMPYCSGISNLIFAYMMARDNGEGRMVLENCLVNNVTNLTLLLGLPSLIWGLHIFPKAISSSKKGAKKKAPKPNQKVLLAGHLNRLSLLLTLLAVIFFTGILWALTRDKKLDREEGFVLIGIFFFWQCFQVYEVAKQKVQEKKKFEVMIFWDLLIILIGAFGVFITVEGLVTWIDTLGSGFIGQGGMGWITGWLMVLPNALLAMWYTYLGRSDISYSSQVGDGHICIPLCIGLFAVFAGSSFSIGDASTMDKGMLIIMGASVIHMICVGLLGRLPRFLGALFIVAYGYFLYAGLVSA